MMHQAFSNKKPHWFEWPSPCERLTFMDGERLPEQLDITEQDVESLSQAGLVRHRPQKSRPKKRADYEALEYHSLPGDVIATASARQPCLAFNEQCATMLG